MNTEALLATIRGRVQGVGFRLFVLRSAQQLGVRGTTRNRDDGSVEVIAIATPEVLGAFLETLRTGPPGARVEALDRKALYPMPDFDGFEIID